MDPRKIIVSIATIMWILAFLMIVDVPAIHNLNLGYNFFALGIEIILVYIIIDLQKDAKRIYKTHLKTHR